MKRQIDIAAKVAPKSAFMLIMGESGTGKELIARMIHHLSGRKKYVAINCAAIPTTLLESELFGHEAGAFTDARQRKVGRIEESSGGTLVLDEIGDMPLDIQAKMLRVIAERSVTRLGSNELLPVDLRIVAMTNRDIYRLVEAKQFRQDLFFRLRVHEIIVPPLREHREDIPPLVMYFTRLYGELNQVAPAGFSQSVQECFNSYDWPGNVRELENEIRKIMEIIEDREIISDHHLTQSIADFCRKAPPPGPAAVEASFQEKMADHEREELLELLQRHAGNKAAAARTLGVTYQALWKKMRKLGLK
jgi:transcriptional regulator with PAS, ATPase and Fis domain